MCHVPDALLDSPWFQNIPEGIGLQVLQQLLRLIHRSLGNLKHIVVTRHSVILETDLEVFFRRIGQFHENGYLLHNPKNSLIQDFLFSPKYTLHQNVLETVSFVLLLAGTYTLNLPYLVPSYF